MSAIHRVAVGDDSLLDIVSGLESTARKFDGLIAQYVPGTPAPGAPDHPRTLELLLGLIAVRERLRTVFDASCKGIPSEAPTTGESQVEESWLR